MTNLSKWHRSKGFFLGPCDNPMRSDDDARELETMVKQSEADGLGYQRLFVSSEVECKAQDDDLKHTAIWTASTDDIDRDSEVVQPNGINLRFYNKNPLIAFAHKTDEPPVGRALWSKAVEGKLRQRVKFADRPDDWEGGWFADQIFALMDQGILKGVSIGFLPTEASNPTEKEIKARPELAGAKRIVRKSVLLEVSVVPVGCNQCALIESVQKGLTPAGLVDRFGFELPPVEEKDLWLWETKDCLPDEVKELPVEQVAKACGIPLEHLKQPTKADILRRMLNR